MNPAGMWTTAGLVAVALLYLGGRMGWAFINERIKSVAAEISAKSLADYKAEHDKALAELGAEHQRRLKEHSLYREKRHVVYGRLYKRVSIAADRFGSMLGLTTGPDFAKYTPDDARSYFDRAEVPQSSRTPIEAAFEAGDRGEAARLLNRLHERVQRRDANRAFVRAKGIERVCELYLSDAVRAQMTVVRATMARVSVALDREDEHDPKEMEKKDAMNTAVDDLFKLMRTEIDQ